MPAASAPGAVGERLPGRAVSPSGLLVTALVHRPASPQVRVLAGALAVAALLGALVCAGAAVREHGRSQVLRERGASARATLVQLDVGRPAGAVATFTTAAGREVRTGVLHPAGPLRLGMPLAVTYDPRHPGDVRLSRDVGGQRTTTDALGAGACALLAVLQGWRAARPRPARPARATAPAAAQSPGDA